MRGQAVRQLLLRAATALEAAGASGRALPSLAQRAAAALPLAVSAPAGAAALHGLALREPLAPSLPARHDQRRGMFIQTQSTPNPSSLMFLPGQKVMEGATPGGSRSKSFTSAREAMASPLAKRLFQIDGVSQIFFGSDFVTVTKSEDYGWAVLKPDVFAAITEFYASGEPLFYDESAPGAAEHIITEDDDEIVAMIKELLETRIRPAVQEDGGDIVFRTWDEDTGIVTLKMMGACSGCPSSAVTLKSGIENMLMHYIPEVKGVVEAEPDESENEGLKAFAKMEQHLSN
ncbi:nifU mitochondrial [Micractinium conductrix]|uniref:NifU mitochondrial n=1 Tax=Micractinium conductrix TaxID=554055 RepID=A0A2P6V9W1_9CHLO|nr:nifU mitochondrial [Micractinium conductrix]|eukprot:PSC70877.1 nifU mitochondrial [Micractinium conductrix]